MMPTRPPAPSGGPQAAPIPQGPAPAARAQPLSSEELLRGQRMVEIEHNGELYRLQATRLGKLILTK
jgi:hemin uptake protein HemP